MRTPDSATASRFRRLDARRVATLTHVLSWIAIGAFVLASVDYGLYALRVGRNVWCGNTLTDPLSVLLSYFAPGAGCAVVALSYLWFRGALRVWSPASALAISGVTVVSLFAYGFWLFRNMLPSHSLSDIVWWLGPVWRSFDIRGV